MNLSPHFTLEEFTHSNTAIRAGISNEPDEAILARLKRVAAMLEQVRAYLGKPIQKNEELRGLKRHALVSGCTLPES